MNNIELLPKQDEFVFDRHPFACYAGGFGSGKTLAGCVKGLLLSQLMPNNFGLVGRLTYPELRDTTRKTFFEITPPDWYDPKNGGIWKESENYLRLYNGSEVIFRHLDKISQKEILSLNLGWFFIDQAEEISYDVFLTLISRLRLNRVPTHYGFVGCNHEGHNWIYDRFKRKPRNDSSLTEGSTYDNPHNPKDYVKRLEENYPPEWVKRYVSGSWDVFMGQVFEEFDDKVHVINPFIIPNEWERIVSIDHGLVNPTAVLWGAIDFDENIYLYDEYYKANEIISEHARRIWEKTGDDNITTWVIDPTTRAKTMIKNGMPWSVLEEYEDNGLQLVPANNEVLASINRIKEYLHIQKDRINPITQQKGSPKLFIFKNCPNLIEELKTYRWKKQMISQEQNAPEKPVKYKDHTVDALRYLIMSRPEPTQRLPGGVPFTQKQARRNTNEMTQNTNYNLDKEHQIYAE